MIVVAALYRFVPIDQPTALQAQLKTALQKLGIKGSLLVAGEGINGTLAGSREAVDGLLSVLRAIPGCEALEHKESAATHMPFKRLKVLLKREIVTMGIAGLDPNRQVGTYIAPQNWNALISQEDVVVIDTRNDFEVEYGTFKGALDPKTRSFGQFPAWLEQHRELLKGKRLAMFCTGGIRCEKATAYALSQGFPEVYHLKGGILKYLEEIPEEQSLWQGGCFVFDERVALGHGLKEQL
jgi:UPF0176 protein